MSYIDKLKIQGIRSFSPNQPAVIQFYRPLTFIVGPNGCGKTTTIECLRYATTGQLPPGSDGGRNFVHDPSIAGETNVSSSVSLKFMGKNGRPMKVTRIAEVAMKKTKLSFTSKDTTIQLVDEHGTTKSYNHKVKDANTMIPEFLSVSKAVLDNVIFTHQEESNWPLGDNKELKSRFDQIFESTRYTKALEDLQKQKKEKKAEGDNSKRDLDVIRANLAIFFERRKELEKVKRDIAGLTDTKINAEKELREIGTELQDLGRKRHEGQAFKETLQKLNVQLEQKKQESDRAYDEIDQEYSETLAQLKILLQKVDFNPDDTASKMEVLHLEKGKLGRKKELLDNEKDHINTQLGKINHELSEGEKNLNVHFQNMISVSRRYSLPGNAMDKDSITSDASKKLLRALKKVHADKRQIFENGTKKYDKANKELSDAEQALEVENRSYERQIDDRKNRKIAIGNEIKHEREQQNSSNRSRLESERQRNENNILKSKKKLDDFENNNEEGVEKKRLDELNERKNDLTFEIKELRNKCEDYERNASALASIEQKKDIVNNEMTILTNIQNDIEADLRALFDSDNESDLEHLCERIENHLQLKEELYKVAQKRVMHLTADFKADERKIQDIKADCANELSILETKRSKLMRDYLPIIKEMCEDNSAALNKDNSEKCLNSINQKLASKEDVYHVKNAMISMMEKAEITARNKHQCFLCKRDFDHEEENAFLEMLNKVNQDDSLQTVINDLKTKAKSVKQFHFNLTNDVLPKETQVKEKNTLQGTLVESLGEKKLKLNDEEKKCDESLKELEHARKLSGPAQKYLDQLKKYEKKKEEYEEESSKFSSLSVNGSEYNSQQLLENVRNEKNDKENEKEEVEESIEKSQKKLDNIRQEVRMENNKYQKLLEKKNQIENSLKESAGIEEKIERLSKEKKSLDGDIDNLKDKMKITREQLNQNIRLKISEKAKFDSERKEFEDDFNTCDQLLKTYEQSHTTILEYFSKELQLQQDELNNSQQKNKDSILKITNDMEQIQKEMEALSSQKDDSKYRNLMKNIRYKELEEEIKGLEVQIEVQERGLNDLDIPHVKQRYEDLQKRERELSNTLASDSGRRKELKQQETNVANALRNPVYHKIEEKHSEKIIEYETLVMTVKDLDKYYKALDSALHQYHSTKIVEINTYIKELWKLTYKGGDIDTIEIQSDAKEKKGGRGRQYNYRVVMSKGGSTGTKAINMRGHCSAGQKVLASLIVRLALAETFCGECGIFCLDEPTTNLDEANKRGFAEALQQILESRKNQKNFQLIVITHDEEFMDYLASQQELGGGLPEAYFRIQREAEGNSMHYHSVARRVTFK